MPRSCAGSHCSRSLHAAPSPSRAKLNNLSFANTQHCIQLFGKPKTVSMHKMFDHYFHSLTTRSTLLYHIIVPCLLNTECEERMFGQCKSITKNISNKHTHTHHIITNISVREKGRKNSMANNLQAQENEVSKLAQSLPLKTNTKEQK